MSAYSWWTSGPARRKQTGWRSPNAVSSHRKTYRLIRRPRHAEGWRRFCPEAMCRNCGDGDTEERRTRRTKNQKNEEPKNCPRRIGRGRPGKFARFRITEQESVWLRLRRVINHLSLPANANRSHSQILSWTIRMDHSIGRLRAALS